MPQTCIVLLPPTTTAASLISRITTLHPVAEATNTHTGWSLTHSLYRATPTSSNSTTTDAASAPKPLTLQVLHISTHPSRTYIHTTSVPSSSQNDANSQSQSQPQQPSQTSTAATSTSASTSATATSVAADSSTVAIDSSSASSFTNLLTNKLQPLWAPVRNHELVVTAGTSLRVGIFDVSVGEIVASRSAAGPAGLRGCALRVALDVGSFGLPHAAGRGAGLGRKLVAEFVEGVLEVELADSKGRMPVVEEYWDDVGAGRASSDGITFLGDGAGEDAAQKQIDEEPEIRLWCDMLRNKALSGVVRKAWDVLDVWTKASTPTDIVA